ncbi:hypothetical protein N7494_009779 [Penicillium frequentans]|uniref:Uncharacterized protein n=1 Tax=Penicillium frequentans TaxID=3151616 RepID=A0AAD6CRA0_9EURO|nr:hypothetical protein N7494_009779 [Penicillium glabrum]
MNPRLFNSIESSSALTDPAHPMNDDPMWSSPDIPRRVANSENMNDLSFTDSWVNTTPYHVSPMHPTASGQSSEQQGACKDTAQKEIPYTCCHKYKRQTLRVQVGKLQEAGSLYPEISAVAPP